MTTDPGGIDEPATPHDAARVYARLGYRIVPIGIGKKWPEMPQWQELATDNLDTIDHWYTGIARGHGVGLLMGHDRLFAVDIDVAHGHDGLETLRALQTAHGELPETVQAETPSGGYHLIYRAPPGVTIRNDAGRRLGPGIDIRGEGGQIVVAPTTRDDGRAYVWVWGCAPWEREPADAPGWLVGLLTQEDQWTKNSPSASTTSPSPSGASASTATAAGPTPSSTPSRTPWPPSSPTSTTDRPGDRFNAATCWEELLATDGWTRVKDGYERHEQRWVRPGKDPREGISATVNANGTDRLHVFTSSVPALVPDTSYSRFGYWAATRHGGDHQAAARALGGGERISVEGLIGEFGATLTSQGPATPGSDSLPGLFRWRLDWPRFWDRDHHDENWHLEPVLARGRGHAIWAGAKTGKSYHVLPMALALATGRAHLNKPDTAPEHVIYMDYEMTEDDLHDRLTEFGYGPEVDLEHLHYISLPSIPGLDTPDGATYVIEAVRSIGATAVIIDTISRAVVGPENDADTFRAFYRHTGQALKGLGVTWVRLDHGGKDAAKGQRGSSGKNDDVDIVWRLTRRDEGMAFEATHRRMSWVPEKVEVAVKEGIDGSTRFSVPLGDTFPAGTRELMTLLDRLGVPPEAGRHVCRRALTEAGERAANDVLTAAIKRRKLSVAGHGQVVEDLIANLSADSSDSSAKPQVSNLGQVDGQARTGTPSVGADTPVPPIGDRCPHADRSDPFGIYS